MLLMDLHVGVVVGIASRVVLVSALGRVTKIVELGSGNAHVSFITIAAETLIASSTGQFFGLSFTGDTLFQNELSGLGFGYLTTSSLYSNLDPHSCPIFGDYEQLCKS